MKIELPDTRPYGAMFAIGNRLSGGAVQEIGSLIVKAGYILAASGGADTHRMATDPDPAASALVLADSLGADGMAVTREADIAPYKPLTDIVVEGFLAGIGPSGEEVRIDGTLWLSRADDLNGDGLVNNDDDAGITPLSLADRDRHLFGYQPRTVAPRSAEAGNPLAAPVPDPIEPNDFPLRDTTTLDEINGYANRFLNFHRRGGGGFAASAAVSGALTAGRRVTVRKADADAFSLTLSLPPLTALYRTYCGIGPDKPPHWTRIPLGAMRADTLILRPDGGRAEVIWRSIWPWADHPAGSYRAIRVSEGTI